jgi:hypothetical protein
MISLAPSLDPHVDYDAARYASTFRWMRDSGSSRLGSKL